MLTLYHFPQSRSERFIWLLEELETPYTIKHVSISLRDGTGAIDPANPHPHGKVPVIDHDGTIVFESPAIALYLTDTFPKNGIGPVIGDPKRGAYLTWLAYYGDVLEPAFISKLLGFEIPHGSARGSAGWVTAEEVTDLIAKTLANGPYLLGEAFSAADILFGHMLGQFLDTPYLPEPERFTGYLKRLMQRPAYRRAQEKTNG